MNLSVLQRLSEWSSLAALAVCALAAFQCYRRTRAGAPCVLCVSSALIVIAALTIEALPSYDLRPDRVTGNIVAVAQYHSLHAFLYVMLMGATLTFVAALCVVLHHVPAASPQSGGGQPTSSP
jgi:hypothetical protein